MVYLLAICIIELILFFLTYKPGTFLVGWDNVMPEFNLWLNLERSLTSIWQEYRGLGLVDGMAHSANLFHTLYISILSMAIPQSAVRYVFIFLTHLAGGIGMYYLILHYTKKKNISFLAALFYMFNLGVVQMYFAPLEVFAVHFAAMPFLCLGIIRFLEHATKKNALLLFGIFLLTTPQSFVPTVFLAWCVVFMALIGYYAFSKRNIKQIIIVCVLFFAANAFWLLPYVYSLKYTTQTIPNSKINQFSSEEIFYRNKAFGGLTDVLQMKGFMMDTVETDAVNNKNVFFMDAWRTHTATPLYKIISGFFIGITALGIFAFFKKRKYSYTPYLLSFGVSFLFLANNTPILEQMNNFIRTVFPIIGEAFRFPFTKFITVFAFSFSVLLALGFEYLCEFVKYKSRIVFFAVLLLLAYLSFPAFTGYFTSPLLRQKIPHEYMQMMAYLSTQPTDKRIGMLPVHTFWNWELKKWGHIGSGFVWYGIPQPMLLRSFDPWSLYNEQFYNELSSSINTGDPDLFAQVLEKYDIQLLLLDQSIINTTSSKPINYEKLITFLSTVPGLAVEATYGNLSLYAYKGRSYRTYTLPKTAATVPPASLFTRKDRAYRDYGPYLVDDHTTTAFYPFPPLFTEKLQSDIPFTAKKNADTITISSESNNTLPSGTYTIYIPNMLADEYLIPVTMTADDGKLTVEILYPSLSINGKLLQFSPAPMVYDFQNIRNPVTIQLPDQNLTINSGAKVYLRNNFTNTVIVSDGVIQEAITIDLSSKSEGVYFVGSYQGNLSNIQAVVPIIPTSFSGEKIITREQFEVKTPAADLSSMKNKESYLKTADENAGHSFEVKNYSSEISVWIPTLPHQSSYIIFTETGYQSGLPVTFSIDNPYEKRSELETRLPKLNTTSTIVLPKTQDFYEGYGFHFIVKSLGTEIARSTVKDMSIYPFPLQTLEGIRLVRQERSPVRAEKKYLKAKRVTSYEYTISDTSGDVVVLSQAYNPDWTAFRVNKLDIFSQYFPFLAGTRVEKHILVNNWANGWVLDSKEKQNIVIIFWPQYLQFFGLGVMFVMGVALLLYRYKKRVHTPLPKHLTN